MKPEEKAKAYVQAIKDGTNIQKVTRVKVCKSVSISGVASLYQNWLDEGDFDEILYVNSLTEKLGFRECGLIITYTKLVDKFD